MITHSCKRFENETKQKMQLQLDVLIHKITALDVIKRKIFKSRYKLYDTCMILASLNLFYIQHMILNKLSFVFLNLYSRNYIRKFDKFYCKNYIMR